MRVGLVLSGGGFPAMAFHAGSLLALHTDHGWDPRSADVVAGTSAGSMIAALLRAGASVDDLAAWAAQVPALPGHERMRSAIDRLDATGLQARPPHPTVRADTWRARVFAALGVGVLDYTTALSAVEPLFDGWPDEQLLVPAVRERDRRRVVFGREARPSVPDAIAASTALPVLFRPVDIDGDRYVDGGVHSPTNADLLLDENVDVAIVIATDGPGRTWSPLRRRARRRSRQEIAELVASGVEVVSITPNAETRRLLGRNALTRRSTRAILTSAYLHAAERLDARDRAVLRTLTAPHASSTGVQGSATSRFVAPTSTSASTPSLTISSKPSPASQR